MCSVVLFMESPVCEQYLILPTCSAQQHKEEVASTTLMLVYLGISRCGIAASSEPATSKPSTLLCTASKLSMTGLLQRNPDAVG
jgi:hypothetical protein